MFIYLLFCIGIFLKPKTTEISNEFSIVPISVPLSQMKNEGFGTIYNGNEHCSNIYCTNNENTPPNCGIQCSASGSAYCFSYKFYGEKFALYGPRGSNTPYIRYSIDNGEYKSVRLDTYENGNRAFQVMEDVEEGWHTIKVQGDDSGKKFGLYKIAYWPSVKAIRYNVTHHSKKDSNTCKIGSDNVGGSS